MDLTEERIKNVQVIHASGRLDNATAPQMNDRIAELAFIGVYHILLDFSGLEYVSSAGLRVIFSAEKSVKAHSGKLVLCHLNEAVLKVFKMSGALKYLSVFDDMDEALSSFE